MADVPAAHAATDFSYTPPGRNHLFVPGPVNIHDKVQRAMAVPSANHRDAWFAPWFKSILEDTKMIFDTEHGTPFIFPGTGTGGWESALTNTLCPGDKVVTFRFGVFSHLWIDMMQRLGLDVTVIDQPWGEAADEARLDEILRADKDKKIKAVCVVHNETSTGVTSDLAFVRKVMDDNKHPALLMVDGVSSIGALEFRCVVLCVAVRCYCGHPCLHCYCGHPCLCGYCGHPCLRRSVCTASLYFSAPHRSTPSAALTSGASTWR